MGLKTTLSNWFVIKATGNTVSTGPFQGLKYCRSSVGSRFAPKLLGTYEKELSSVIGSMIEQQPNVVIDIGAAEGYYAVGLAQAIPRLKVVAFEAVTSGRELLAEMAILNRVQDRVEIKGFCDAATLKTTLETYGPCWLIVDVEGAEEHLLDVDQIPELLRCHILLEVHDHLSAGIGERIHNRFAGSHHIVAIKQRDRTLSDFPLRRTGHLRMMPQTLVLKSLNEMRAAKMRWFWMVPKQELVRRKN